MQKTSDSDVSREPLFAHRHHARWHEPTVPYHIISRVFQGRHLLRPARRLNDIIAGVIGRAQTLFVDIELFAFAFMSNHVHLMLRGSAAHIPAFIGFIKREISRRWGLEIGWPGTMWDEYVSTALPTDESQSTCLKYVLSQGVKEGLVARPQDWPGVHAAKLLLSGDRLTGGWLDATAYGRAKYRAQGQGRSAGVQQHDYVTEYEVKLAPLPAWQHLSASQQRDEVQHIVAEIVAEGREVRGGHPVLGSRAVMKTPLDRRTALPPPPWFEDRRRMIVWADASAMETQAYVLAYWQFQHAFREASAAYRQGDLDAEFPPGAFRPMLFAPGNQVPLDRLAA